MKIKDEYAVLDKDGYIYYDIPVGEGFVSYKRDFEVVAGDRPKCFKCALAKLPGVCKKMYCLSNERKDNKDVYFVEVLR